MVTFLDGNAQEMFNAILRNEIAPMLRAHGWKGSGNDYKRMSDPYRAFINFQKSVHNTKDEVEFTVNLAVLSDEAIAEHQAAWKRAREQWGPDITLISTWGSWNTRIGFLLPFQRDKWWRLITGRPPERAVAEVLNAFSESVLPAIERQMDKPRVEPSSVIETRGQPCGRHWLPNGDIRWHNVGGERIYPVDALLDAVDREYVYSEWKPVAPIPVDFQVTQPDGCVSLELDHTRRHLAAEGVELVEGMPVPLFQWRVDPKGHRFVSPMAGDAHYDEKWGWGAEVSPSLLQKIADVSDGLPPAL